NRSCMAYRTFEKQGDDWSVIGTGLIFWDPATRAIRETTVEESTHLFQDGTWRPEGDRLIGEFIDHEVNGTRRKTHFVIRFVDRDTIEMSGERRHDFKRARPDDSSPSGSRRGDPYSLRVHRVNTPQGQR